MLFRCNGPQNRAFRVNVFVVDQSRTNLCGQWYISVGERFSVVLPDSWVAGASSTVWLTGLL